jgi:hypothetical protein
MRTEPPTLTLAEATATKARLEHSIADLWAVHDKAMLFDQPGGCWLCGEQEYSPMGAMINGELRLICHHCEDA